MKLVSRVQIEAKTIHICFAQKPLGKAWIYADLYQLSLK